MWLSEPVLSVFFQGFPMIFPVVAFDSLRVPHDPSDARAVKRPRRREPLKGVHQWLFRSDRLDLEVRTEWYSLSQGSRGMGPICGAE